MNKSPSILLVYYQVYINISFKHTNACAILIITMLFSKVAFLYFLIFVKKLCYGYEIPEPEIIAYRPSGLRVSIPHSEGISLFAFHGNLNKNIKTLQYGEITVEVNREANGRWSFYHPQAKVNIGDTLNYWILILKHSLGYRRQFQPYRITELSHHSTLAQSAVRASLSDTVEIKKDNCNNDDNMLCLQSILNITQSLVQLQNEYDIVSKQNKKMRNYLESMPDAKLLTLSGKIPPEGQAAGIASFVLRERVDIDPVIIRAQRNDDGSITFEVATVDDKLDILEKAKKKLVTTKILIH